MTNFASRLLDLLQRYAAAGGGDPGAFCQDAPDLLPAFQAALAQLAAVERTFSDAAAATSPFDAPGAAAPSVVVPGFVLETVLGRGGMGVVYRAREPALRRQVAIKMILAGAHAGPAALARFQREAEAVARLRHPGLVQLYHIGEWTTGDGSRGPFMALEYLAGGSLAALLKTGLLPATIAAQLVKNLASAVQHAHAAGVIHRDLKPANVLLEAPWSPSAPEPPAVKIADFGMARLLDEEDAQTRTGAILGTPSYMAPEQAAGLAHAVGPACDIWAIGTLLYECLLGRPPFRGATTAETLHLVRTAEPVPPRQMNPHLPRDLETICLKCLRKEPTQRYASAQALADDLTRFLAGEPIRARPVGVLERAAKWVARNRLVTGLTLAVAVTLLVGAGVAGYFAIVAEQRAEDALGQTSRALKSAALGREALNLAEFEAEAATQARHAIELQLAQRAWNDGAITEAEFVLSKIDAPLRATWEARYLADLCQRRARPLVGHGDRVGVVAYHPDGRHAVAGGHGQHLTFWELPTGRLLGTVSGAPHYVTALAFSGDGKVLASASGTPGNPCRVRLWSFPEVQELACFDGHRSSVHALALDHTGMTVASASWDRTVRIWGKDRHVLTGHTGPVIGVALTADGRTVVSASHDRSVRVWDAVAGTGRVVRELPGACRAMTLSRDERTLVVAADRGAEENDLHVADFPEGRTWRVLANTARVNKLALSGDGATLLTGTQDRVLLVLDTKTGRERHRLHGNGLPVTSVAAGPDGRTFLSAAESDPVSQPPRFWDLGSGRATRTLLGHREAVISLGVLDGTLISTGRDQTIRLWDLASGAAEGQWPGHTGPVHAVRPGTPGRAVSWSMHERVLELKVWDRATGRDISTRRQDDRTIRAADLFPDGQRLALAQGAPDAPGEVVVVPLAGGEPESVLPWRPERPCAVGRLRISPEGAYVVAVGSELNRYSQLVLWHPASGRKLHEVMIWNTTVRGLVFTRAGLLLVGCDNGKVAVWNLATGAIGRWIGEFGGGGEVLALSPDERLLASAGSRGIRLYDFVTGQSKLVLDCPERVVALAFTPDGRTLLAGTQSGAIHLWDAPP